MKIAVVGGGSTYTPELVSGLTRLDVGQRPAAQDRDHDPGRTLELPLDLLQLRGLVAEDDDVGPLGHGAIGVQRLPGHLARQLGRPPGQGVGTQHWLGPAASERTRHVPGSDQTDLHGGQG